MNSFGFGTADFSSFVLRFVLLFYFVARLRGLFEFVISIPEKDGRKDTERIFDS